MRLYHFVVASFRSTGLHWLCIVLLTEVMLSLFSSRASKSGPSPLEGLGAFRAQQADSDLRRLARREWWLWLSAFFVTLLSAIAFLLSSFRSLFLHSDHFYEIRSDQARWATLCLLLLFNAWLVYRQWSFRRLRRQFAEPAVGQEGAAGEVFDPSGVDPLTGLYTRASAEQQLGREIARARRQKISLSVATLHLDDFAQIAAHYGKSAADQVLQEFARRLREVSRGSDFAVRLATDDFLVVLPKCNLGEAKLVLNRLGAVEVNCSGKKIVPSYTTGWVDYQPGDLPWDLLKRATEILHLYDSASKESFSTTLVPR
jgi:diguanylate cyclase (GGDEF)-like protein